MTSRVTKQVRIFNPNNRQSWVDIEILCGFTTLGTDGQEHWFVFGPDSGAADIYDTTGDYGTKNIGQPCRISHIERVVSTQSQTQCLDVEVLDVLSFLSSDGQEFGVAFNFGTLGVCADKAANDSSAAVIGYQSLGAAGSIGSRVTHTCNICETTAPVTDSYGVAGLSINTDDQPNDSSVTLTKNFTTIIKTDSVMVLEGDGTEQHIAFPYNTNNYDATAWTTDAQGNKSPPENADTNPYIVWPENSQSPYVGQDPDHTTRSAVTGPINQGPLWWIKRINNGANVWFWAISPVQQPLAFGYFAGGGPGGGPGLSWGYRGFELLPYFPVIWILSENYPLVNMGTIGAPNIETAAAGYTVVGGDGSTTLSWFGVGYPDGGWGVSTAVTTNGGYLGAGLPFLTYTFTNYYMPFGAFDLTGPTSAELLAVAQQAGDASKYTNFGGPPPNIWELTGIAQPPLQHPGDLWNASANPHLQPSLALAQQVVAAFANNWNVCAGAINTAMASFSGGQWPPWTTANPPGWHWALPYGGNTVPTAQQFSNGFVPAVLPEDTTPATVATITVGQLDSSVWNVEPVVKSGSPPVLWSTGAP